LKGSDGKLVWDRQGQVRLVNLSEKLLVSLLAKFSNFIPEAGIWLNTQRPEWNDANNALVGNGTSVVTLCYLRRFLAFCLEVFRPLEKSEVSLSDEVAKLLLAVCRILQSHRPLLSHRITDRERKRVLNGLARAGSQYREQIYARGFSGRRTRIRGGQLLDFFKVALAFADDSFDYAILSFVLHHTCNPDAILREALRVAREVIVIENDVRGTAWQWLTRALDSYPALRYGTPPCYIAQTREEWVKLFARFPVEARVLSEFSLEYGFFRNFTVILRPQTPDGRLWKTTAVCGQSSAVNG
jgi:hypothetical protein